MGAEMSDHEIASVRTDGDSWAITESVGATALWVAACRSAETAQREPLIRDEFAAQLVAPAGAAWSRLVSGNVETLVYRDGDRAQSADQKEVNR